MGPAAIRFFSVGPQRLFIGIEYINGSIASHHYS